MPKVQKCGRCKEALYSDWEDGWPNHGLIDVGLASQTFAALGGAYIAHDEHFAWWEEGHPAMTLNEAQRVAFEWGWGYAHGSEGGYHLCRECQELLLKTIGEFFGIPERVAQLKEEE